MSSKNTFIAATVALAAIGIAGRLMPHAWNTTPLTAIALFASAYVGVRYSAVAVFAAMFVSDLIIGFYSLPVMISVYAGFGLAILIGAYLRRERTIGRIACATVASSAAFFLVTNWAVWQFGTMYEHSLSGLLQSYAMGLPFWRNALAGDIIYSSAFFGLYEFAIRHSSIRTYVSRYLGVGVRQ